MKDLLQYYDNGSTSNFMKNFFAEDINFLSWQKLVPSIDIKNRENDFDLIVNMPGVKKNNINISIINDIFVIKTQASPKKLNQFISTRADYHDSYGNYCMSINPLNGVYDIAKDDVIASYKNNILKINVKKKNEKKNKEILIDII